MSLSVYPDGELFRASREYPASARAWTVRFEKNSERNYHEFNEQISRRISSKNISSDSFVKKDPAYNAKYQWNIGTKKKLLGIYLDSKYFQAPYVDYIRESITQSALPRRDLSDIENAGRVALSGRKVVRTNK